MSKIICMYLPQFHEFEENNRWWGKGFTEWTCVNRAKSLTNGHVIRRPHHDIGYYNLLNKSVRKKQACMAKEYNVYGFCYYHYWFYDKVLMETPLELMLQDGEPDLPFMLSWANEHWTRKMNGGNGEITQPQRYGDEDEWKRHLEYLIKYFINPNYIKIDNKPVFCIYRMSIIDNCIARINYWKKAIKDYGFDGLHIVMTLGVWPKEEALYLLPYVDAVFDFYPNFLRHPSIISYEIDNIAFCEMKNAYSKILNETSIHHNHYKGMMVGFDNSPRSPKKASVFINNSPELFYHAMKLQFQQSHSDFIFVNSWNEWGEQAAIEPDELYGYDFLEKIRKGTKCLKIL